MGRHLVIFDCDGTLVDSQHVIVAAMEMAFTGEGLAPPLREEILSIVGLSLPKAIWKLGQLMAGPPSEDVVLRIMQGYKGAFGTLRRDPSHEEPMYPGAHDAVLELAARDDVILGIATGKSRPGVDRLLAREGLQEYFATIQTADDAPSKPHPAMVEQAMAETGVAPETTFMIGDTTFDIEMGRSAGAHAIGVSWGYHPVGDLRQAGAHHVADDYPGLMSLLTKTLESASNEAAE